MRLNFTLYCFLCIGAIGLADAAEIDVAKQSSFVNASIWIVQSQTDADDYKYVIDLQKEKLVSSKLRHIRNRREAEFEKRLDDRKNQSSAAHSRILKVIKAWKGKSQPDANLLKSLKEPDFIKWVTPSSNGLFAIIVADDNPILLVEIETLNTFIIGKVNKEHSYLKTPIAWSPDSRLIAFAPPDSDTFYIYSIDKHAIVSAKSGIGRWVRALSFSPDMTQLAAFTFQNRRLSKAPMGLLGYLLGHPDYRNDGVFTVYHIASEQKFSLVLKSGMSEMKSSKIEIEWK